MTRKDFIELADAIKEHNASPGSIRFTQTQINALARFCASQNPRFDRARWLGYIDGTNGPSGGRVKKESSR